jgi:hypothetical protein
LYYTEFEVEFTQFFAEMEAFVKEKMNEWDWIILCKIWFWNDFLLKF